MIFKLSTVILLFSFITAGCRKDDIFELDIGDENAVIQHQVNGIEFKFCLLNEEGEPATVFNEGENFTFQFSFRNLKKDTIIVTTEFIYNEFFRVYQVSGDNLIDKGKPWTGVWCDFSLNPQEFILTPNKMVTMQFPWILNVNSINFSPLCSNIKLEHLDIGKYLTGFDLNFHYQLNGKENIINKLKFKINFEIK